MFLLPHPDADALSLELSKLLWRLKVIRGMLVIRETNFKDLSFLANLTSIQGLNALNDR